LGIGGIIALAAALSKLFGGGDGGAGDGTGTDGTTTTGASLERLLPQIESQLQQERLFGLRSSFLSDPALASFITPDQQKALGLEGVPLGGLASGGVPLQRAVMNLAFGLLPRFARSSQFGGGGPTPFVGTPEQRALMIAAPRTRFGRFGFGTEGSEGSETPNFEGQTYSDVLRRYFPDVLGDQGDQ